MTMTVANQAEKDIRAVLEGLHLELSAEYDEATATVADIAKRADTDGDDEVDAGAKTAQREHQLTLVAAILERRIQVERALERVAAGSYGNCENCTQSIPAERLEAFPSATLCVSCKQTVERRP